MFGVLLIILLDGRKFNSKGGVIMSTKKLQIIDSLVKQAENANTLDGKSAEEFALTSDIEQLQSQVGDSSVADQISSAVSTLSETSVPVERTIAGLDLVDDISKNELNMALGVESIIKSDEPPYETVGRAGQLYVEELEDGSANVYIQVDAVAGKNWLNITDGLTDNVKKTLEIAGINLSDNITADELREAIGAQRVIVNTTEPPETERENYAEIGDFYFRNM